MNLTLTDNRLHGMSEAAVDNVRTLETAMRAHTERVDIPTSHMLHAGVYARTVSIPKGVVITGALIKRATVLIIHGDALVSLGDENIELEGYNMLAASAHRKQAFYARTDLVLTMLFATNATTVEEAEGEFTDEGDLLQSRQPGSTNHYVITGE